MLTFLAPFDGPQRAAIIAAAHMMIEGGISPEEVIRLHNLDMRAAMQQGNRPSRRPPRSETLENTLPPVCPACGRDRLVPVANAEGLFIFGCRACRYSKIQER